eukprot:14201802-Alexandrium_andersonii.AAC.1
MPGLALEHRWIGICARQKILAVHLSATSQCLTWHCRWKPPNRDCTNGTRSYILMLALSDPRSPLTCQCAASLDPTVTSGPESRPFAKSAHRLTGPPSCACDANQGSNGAGRPAGQKEASEEPVPLPGAKMTGGRAAMSRHAMQRAHQIWLTGGKS